jgi:Holliday junction resolvase
MQPEAKIGRKIREYIEERGGFVFKVHGGPQMMAGLPDLIACIQGLFFGIEVKQPGQNPTARQVFVHKMIQRSGGVAIVAHSVEEAADAIEQVFTAPEHRRTTS